MQTSHGMAMMLRYQSMFLRVTTTCAVCSNLQLWKGRRKHCGCGRQIQKFTCRKSNKIQIETNIKHDRKVKLGYAFLCFFLRMKTLLTLIPRNLVGRRSTSTVLFIFKKPHLYEQVFLVKVAIKYIKAWFFADLKGSTVKYF